MNITLDISIFDYVTKCLDINLVTFGDEICAMYIYVYIYFYLFVSGG